MYLYSYYKVIRKYIMCIYIGIYCYACLPTYIHYTLIIFCQNNKANTSTTYMNKNVFYASLRVEYNT